MAIKPINAKYFDLDGIADKIGKVLNKYAEKAEQDFDNTTKTWKHDINFEKEVTLRGNKMEVSVFTKSDIFRFVNDGTAVRFATMTPDFRPKTKPGSLRSSSGRGGLQYVNKQYPRPGIKPREFTDTIVEKHDKKFVNDIQKASASGARLRVLKLITSVSRAMSRIRRAL